MFDIQLWLFSSH